LREAVLGFQTQYALPECRRPSITFPAPKHCLLLLAPREESGGGEFVEGESARALVDDELFEDAGR